MHLCTRSWFGTFLWTDSRFVFAADKFIGNIGMAYECEKPGLMIVDLAIFKFHRRKKLTDERPR